MPDTGNPNSILSLELALLRAFCSSKNVCAARDQIASVLPGYKWQDPENAIVYAALCKVSGRDSQPLREQLSAIATRMGFPDVAWEDYFVADAAAEQEILELLSKLAAMTALRP